MSYAAIVGDSTVFASGHSMNEMLDRFDPFHSREAMMNPDIGQRSEDYDADSLYNYGNNPACDADTEIHFTFSDESGIW